MMVNKLIWFSQKLFVILHCDSIMGHSDSKSKKEARLKENLTSLNQKVMTENTNKEMKETIEMNKTIKIEEARALKSKKLLSFASALNADLYNYLCKGCKDGWDCDWDKLDSRLKPGVNIEIYSKIKSMREVLKRLIAGVIKTDLKTSLAVMLKNSFVCGLKLPITSKEVRSVLNRKPIKEDYFLYLLIAEGIERGEVEFE